MKRKLIDLDLETERRLSILASANGMSLKKYIQHILSRHGNEHSITIEKYPPDEPHIALIKKLI